MPSETEHPADGYVASLDSLPDLSPNERLPPQRGRAEPAGGPHLGAHPGRLALGNAGPRRAALGACHHAPRLIVRARDAGHPSNAGERSEEHTSELQSQFHLVCRLLLEKKKMLLIKFSKTLTYNHKCT